MSYPIFYVHFQQLTLQNFLESFLITINLWNPSAKVLRVNHDKKKQSYLSKITYPRKRRMKKEKWKNERKSSGCWLHEFSASFTQQRTKGKNEGSWSGRGLHPRQWLLCPPRKIITAALRWSCSAARLTSSGESAAFFNVTKVRLRPDSWHFLLIFGSLGFFLIQGKCWELPILMKNRARFHLGLPILNFFSFFFGLLIS